MEGFAPSLSALSMPLPKIHDLSPFPGLIKGVLPPPPPPPSHTDSLFSSISLLRSIALCCCHHL